MTHAEFLKKVGIELKVARIRAGMTTAQVIKSTGLSKASINHIEGGKVDAHILSYKRICDAIGVDMKDIL